jgi:type I restriction enzyme M protein
MRQKKFDKSTMTTPQHLSSIIKSVRDIMRKDKGLNGDLDRIPMITWIMFLKFLDDHEQIREAEAKLNGIRYQSIITSPYRWRDWATKDDGITGDELIAFINQDEAVKPDGIRGLGLFAYLRSLSGSEGKDKRDVVATIFKGISNRMINGYLLRDVINKIDEIRFGSTEEIHTLAFLYETLLKEMRDSAGDSGEFYTPRPVIKFMVQVINPRIGETILDPAAGTGGFLVDSYEHIKKQCNKAEDFKQLQEHTLLGFEAKSMPFLLCQMNMLLHGIETPEIDSGNALRFSLREIGDKERVNVILTNPPFGGEEERGILSNFPEDKQTAETALLFLQLIMRKLQRPNGTEVGGRCGIVVPNGTLFGDGVCARIKKQLLDEYRLHTIIRLPKGVFSPYADINTNLLFFEKDGPTKEIWYYEIPLPNGKKQFTKTNPITMEDFQSCLDWWTNRESNDYAWKVEVNNLIKYDENGSLLSVNLDVKNPKSKIELNIKTAEEIIEELSVNELNIIKKIEEIRQIIKN